MKLHMHTHKGKICTHLRVFLGVLPLQLSPVKMRNFTAQNERLYITVQEHTYSIDLLLLIPREINLKSISHDIWPQLFYSSCNLAPGLGKPLNVILLAAENHFQVQPCSRFSTSYSSGYHHLLASHTIVSALCSLLFSNSLDLLPH